MSTDHPSQPGHEPTLTESPQYQQTTTTPVTPNEADDHASHENTHENTPDSETTIPSNSNAHTGPAQEYLVKTIHWTDFDTREAKDVRIITQNENGPCPLVAICNVLFLRGDLEIRPPDREVVTFEYLVERLGDYLLNHGPSTTTTNNQDKPSSTPTSPNDDDNNNNKMMRTKSSAQSSTQEYVLTYRYNLDAALSILPNLQTGLDVNVRFSSIRNFEPTAELAMFDLFDVDLFHGWVVDPQDEETYRVVAEKCGSYNAVVECVVRADTLNDKKDWTQEDELQMHEGLVASSFLDDTATQLTYYGLQQLADTVTPNKPFVFFRNNHFSTLLKHPDSSGLFMLVTDSGLVSQKSVVWESLGDIDQGSSEFFDGSFCKPSMIQDIPENVGADGDTELDYALALSLQQQEISTANESRRQQVAQRDQIRQQQHEAQQQQQQQQQRQRWEHDAATSMKRKSKQNCVIS
ncbi:DUF544-domain-containing protein [Lichtheimia hyalospora FSU 10163]|nr:DUF544-domain-containing protein [Lichtheimia hyalospora FSU 10163]